MEKRESSTHCRIKTKKVCFFFGMFIAYLLFLTMVMHFNDFLGMGKQSWSEIFNDLWLYSIGAFFAAVVSYVKHF
jgi:hypothetical protein